MNIFDTERPELGSGAKALLHEGSAIPPFVITFDSPDFVTVSLMVRYYEVSHRAYSYVSRKVKPCDVTALIMAYIDDPELTLETYFGWKAIEAKPSPSPVARKPIVTEFVSFGDSMDLL